MRRWAGLAVGLALVAGTPQAAVAQAAVKPVTQPGSAYEQQDPGGTPADVADAVRRLRAEARGALRVHRDAEGRVDSLTSADGSGVIEPRRRAGDRATVADQLGRYGQAFGLDGSTSRAVVRAEVPSATGGSVVRADQVVDGVPVFGGQLVTSLDRDDSVVSVTAATTEAQQVPAPEVSQDAAARTARAATARAEKVAPGSLTVALVGRRLYDPALVHVTDPGGTRPVWQFEVDDATSVRETVLVGTGHGEVALRFDDAPGLDRSVCDNASARDLSESSGHAVPLCTSPARGEGSQPSGVADVDAAYDNLGATAEAYQRLDGLDLTRLIGVGGASLTATVRWCWTEADACPYANAFWDGRQMVFGEGYAGADDVVGHELTHGYVERTSGLFAFHQSGAINESLADVVGEVVDHGHGTEDDSAWTVGEDLPDGSIRSLADPARYGQPDSVTSPLFSSADVFEDGGAVHENDGVGNKTAYLISHGGTFGGRTVTGIDGGDTRLSKTGRLYLEVIPRLTSGSEYADLGRVLVSTCQELAAAGTGGFTAADCASVTAAVAATGLSSAPTDPAAAAPEAPQTCPTGYDVHQLARDDDGFDDFTWQLGGLWQRTSPTGDAPTYATSGTSSLFAWDPDPSYGDPASSDAVSRSFVVPDAPTYLHLHHAELLEYDAGASAYYDGGQVLVQTQEPDGSWVTAAPLPWVAGPTRDVAGGKAFGGDSHGYGSSRLDLSSLRNQTVRFVLRVTGDPSVAFLGWWVDDVRLYTCVGRPPGAVASTSFTTSYPGSGRVVVGWRTPADVGSGIGYYRWRSSGGEWDTAQPGSRTASVLMRGPAPGTWIRVTPYNKEGVAGPSTTLQLVRTRVATAVSASRVRRSRPFTLTAALTREGTSTRVSGAPVVLQSMVSGTHHWRDVARATTSAGAARWTLRQTRTTAYRVQMRGASVWEPSTSASRTVLTR